MSYWFRKWWVLQGGGQSTSFRVVRVIGHLCQWWIRQFSVIFKPRLLNNHKTGFQNVDIFSCTTLFWILLNNLEMSVMLGLGLGLALRSYLIFRGLGLDTLGLGLTTISVKSCRVSHSPTNWCVSFCLIRQDTVVQLVLYVLHCMAGRAQRPIQILPLPKWWPNANGSDEHAARSNVYHKMHR